MNNLSRTKSELIKANALLKQRINELEQAESNRKRAEDLLQDEKGKLLAIINATTDRIYLIDTEGAILAINKAGALYSGMEIDSAVGTNIFNNLTSDVAQKRKAIIREICLTQQPLRIEYEYEGKWTDSHFFPVVVNEKVTRIVAYGRDITERKQMEEELRNRDITRRKQAEEEALRDRDIKFKKLSAWVPGIIYQFTKRPDGTYCVPFATEAIRDLYGCSPEDVREDFSPIVRVILPEDLDNFLGSIEYSTKHMTNWTCEYRVQIPGQPIRWTLGNSTPEKLADGSITWYGFNTDITERKRADEELRESERRYRQFFCTSRDCVFITSKEGKWINFNDAAVEMFGYDNREELSQVPISALYVNPDERTMLTALIEKQGYVKEYPVLLRRKDGAVIDVLITTGFRQDADGNKMEYYGTIRNITRQKYAEESLSKSERKFSSIFQFNPNPMAITDMATWKFIDVNHAYTRWTGYSREELIGSSTQDLHLWVNPEDREKIIGTLTETGEVNGEEVLVRQKNGNVRIVLFSARSIEIEQEHYLLTLAHDITERKQAEEDLRQSEENYRSIFENAQEGIYRTTPEGRFIMANQAMAQILGYDSPEELIKGMADITHQLYVSPEERTKAIELVEQQGLAKDMELQFYRKDGRATWVHRTMRPIRDEKGQILFYEGIVQDITDRKENVERLRKALGGTIQAIAALVEARDPYTAGHQSRVSDLARAIAREMGLSDEQVEGIRTAGKIHDIGKISVPAEILSSPRKLTDIEFSLIKTHSQSGYDILKDIEFPWPIARMILEHHERIDGSGYPNGLTGDNLLLESRVLSVADMVEAIATHRPYRPALGLDAALEEISKSKGFLYDTAAVDACLRLFKEKGYRLVEA